MMTLILIVAVLCVGAVPVIWMWRRIREERRTSLDDYVARSKAQAKADLGTYLEQEPPDPS